MSNTQQTLAQMVRAKYPGAYSDMDDVTLEKNVLAKHPEYSDLPRTKAQSDMQHTLLNMTAAMSGQPMQTPAEQAEFEQGKKAGATSAAETVGGTLGAESFPAMRGLVGALARIFATGGGAAAGNAAGQLGTTGTIDPAQVGTAGATWSGFAAGGETLGALSEARTALGSMLYGPDGKLSSFGKALVHPTQLPEQILRATIPPPEPTVAKAVPIRTSPNFNAQEYNAGRASMNPPEPAAPAPPSPFAGATSTATPVGNAKLPVTGDIPKGSSTPFGEPTNIQYVDKFGKPATGKIVEPGSTPPDVKVTYQSVPKAQLYGKVMSGDMNAINEWMRRGLELPDNVKFLVEDAGAKPWRNYDK
jgi:hypothetical protein